jgi:hypothetical protein
MVLLDKRECNKILKFVQQCQRYCKGCISSCNNIISFTSILLHVDSKIATKIIVSQYLMTMTEFAKKMMMGICYHDKGSKKLNTCIRFFLHMVYLLFRTEDAGFNLRSS